MQTLYVFYDDRCELCRRVRHWAHDRPAFVRLVFLRAGSAEAEQIAPGLTGNTVAVKDLVAVGDGGEVYRGDSAWVMGFYALEEFREWSYRMASPALRPFARRAFGFLATHRANVSDWMGWTDDKAAEVFGRVEEPACVSAASGLRKIHEMIAGPEPRDATPGR